MKKADIETFIDEMSSFGDEWSEDQVEDCYGDMSLDEALESRRSEVGLFLSSLGTAVSCVLNRD